MQTKFSILTGLATGVLASIVPATAASVNFVNTISIAGNAPDLYPTGGGPGGANVNRFGGFSDLYYDRSSNTYFALADRGAGGGTLPYNTRVEQFTLNVNPTTGQISNFNIINTIAFTNNGAPFNGLNPLSLNGSVSVLGNSFDPEGFTIGANGHFFVADEYGPSVYEFDKNGAFIRGFTEPNNVLPRAGAGLDFVDDRTVLTSGRQDNRGYEGLTLSPDGSKLYAVLQDPLVNEGMGNDGRRSQNLRIVEFNTQTGRPTRQFTYQLESISTINDRIPGTANDFTATAQGRSIGVSAIYALDDHRFLVVERDNIGLGVTDPTGALPVGSKRVYLIDINGATDVSNVSFAGSNSLPAGVVPVGKSLYLDIQAALEAAGVKIPEKLEGLTFGPQLANGGFELLIGNDDDFSVTQNASNVQFDVCSGGGQVPLDSGCPAGQQLLKSSLFAFTDTTNLPEPSTWMLCAVPLAFFAWRRRRSA